jgi:hypothetical protein
LLKLAQWAEKCIAVSKQNHISRLARQGGRSKMSHGQPERTIVDAFAHYDVEFHAWNRQLRQNA